jgi:uncharacterized protein
MNFSRWTLIVALTVLAIGVLFLLFELGLLARDARAAMWQLEGESHTVLAQFSGTLGNVDSAMTDVHSIELETQRTEEEMAGLLNQTRHGMLTQQQETALVGRANAVLDDSDAAIRNLDQTIVKLGDIAPAVEQTASTVNQTILSAQPGILDLNKAAAGAATAMSDPAIHETMVHVDGTAGNLDATSSDIHDFVHRETTPVRGTWNVIKAFLSEFAGPAAQVATAAK